MAILVYNPLVNLCANRKYCDKKAVLSINRKGNLDTGNHSRSVVKIFDKLDTHGHKIRFCNGTKFLGKWRFRIPTR